MSTPTEPSSRGAIWAESGDVTAPSTGEQQSGFVQDVKPNRRKVNWFLGWLDNAVQFLLEANSSFGTASGLCSGGDFAMSDGVSTVVNPQHINAPRTTHKQVIFTLHLHCSGGVGSTNVTFSGDTAFFTGVKHAFAGTLDQGSCTVTTGGADELVVTAQGQGSATSVNIEIMATGW